ncbi:MAG: thiamine pyrophosphate-binding protein, partial [Nitrososphaerales archaeon]
MSQGKTRISKAEYGSDVVVDMLKAYGVEYVALNPGATFRGLQDSIVNYGGNKNPEVIEVCHEEIAVAISHGYYKAKGKPMAVLAHDTVGLLHASMAMFNAWCDNVPVLVMGGTGPMDITKRRPWIDWIHTGLLQGNLVREYVKWDDQPASVSSFPETIMRGYRSAMIEPKGPVYLCFDAELQEQKLAEPMTIPKVELYPIPSPIQGDFEAMNKAARLLVEATNPVILADAVGRNPDAVHSLVELAETLSAPVLDLGTRLNFIRTHPLDLTGSELTKDADLILALDPFDLYGAISSTDRQTRKSKPLIREDAKVI